MEKQESIAYIRRLLEKQDKLQDLNRAVQETSAALDKAQRALETYKTRITEESAQLVKKQREALENRLEKSVQTAARRVEQAEKKRVQEKEKQKKSHIADATQEYRAQIHQARSQIKTDLKADGVPFYCGSRLWFSLYMPAYLTDYLLIGVFWLVSAIGLPFLIYMLIPDHRIWQFYILLPIFVVASIFIYIETAGRTRKKHKETLGRCREKMNLIHDLKKRIKKTEKQIHKSDDESPYELKELDEKIMQARKDLETARSNQAAGLQEFEQKIRFDIIEEFRVKSQEKLDELTNGIGRLTREKNLTMEMASELHLEIVENYEEQLGAENMNQGRLKELLSLLEDGSADTLEKALILLKAGGHPAAAEPTIEKTAIGIPAIEKPAAAESMDAGTTTAELSAAGAAELEQADSPDFQAAGELPKD
ncbi:MAG: hypothetical protein ACI4D3_11510 [Lachnospiraceae bacterium]